MLLVDSSVWIDYFNGTATHQSDYLDKILGIEDIIIGDLILADVLQGFRLVPKLVKPITFFGSVIFYAPNAPGK